MLKADCYRRGFECSRRREVLTVGGNRWVKRVPPHWVLRVVLPDKRKRTDRPGGTGSSRHSGRKTVDLASCSDPSQRPLLAHWHRPRRPERSECPVPTATRRSPAERPNEVDVSKNA